MRELLRWFRESVTGKLAFVGMLVLVLSIPLNMIEHRIAERGIRAGNARQQIAEVWGSGQLIGGPVLSLPHEHAQLVDGRSSRVGDELYLLPSELDIHVTAESQLLNRGIYEIPVYTATVTINGTLPLPSPGMLDGDAVPYWDEASLSLPIGDARSIRELVEITVGDMSAALVPAGERVRGLGSQLGVPLAALNLASMEEPLEFSITYRVGGTASLGFLPFGDTTRVDLRSDWPSPSFTGRSLPDSRDVDTSGFTAQWQVLALGRGYPSSWRRSDRLDHDLAEQVRGTGFGVDFILPIGVHEASLRAVKYAVLFLALTFAAYFLYELFLPLRLHTLQYLLIGSANVIFYLLLVALSEHVGFRLAYWSSALASTLLISGYSAAILCAWQRAIPIVLLLAAIYGYLYLTLQLEDFALLSGTLALFAILAGTMYLTRHVNWYDVRPLRKHDTGARR